MLQHQQQACSSRTASSASPSSENNLSNISKLLRSFPMPTPPPPHQQQHQSDRDHTRNFPPYHDRDAHLHRQHLELQLLPMSSHATKNHQSSNQNRDENHATQLKLSIGSNDLDGSALGLSTEEHLKMANKEKAFAEEARKQAKRQIELAEMEFANAKRIRQQAQAEFEKAQDLKEQATRKMSSTMLEITCHACKQRFHTTKGSMYSSVADETSLGISYMSNSAITEGEGE